MFFMYTAGTFQTAASVLYLSRLFVNAGSLRMGTQISRQPLAFPELSLLIFKVPRVKYSLPTGCKNL